MIAHPTQTATLPAAESALTEAFRIETPPHLLAPRPAAVEAPRSGYVVAKAVLDFVFALTLLVLTLPVMLLIALLVKLTSRGPVLYSQLRLGKNGRPFTIYKIRTMSPGGRGSGAAWSRQDDPRVTPLGHLLRATHLDELPQLWNILRGDMSLIGPRPEFAEFAPALERAVPAYRQRLQVRPGLTGLAQVQMPPVTDLASVRRKLAYDLYYIRHLSWWLDLCILVCTALHLSGLPCPSLCRSLVTTAREASLGGEAAC